jgi:hypothetical protein
MKTDCIEFNDCRLPVSMCNGKCKLYQPVRKKTYKGSKKWTTGEKHNGRQQKTIQRGS